MNYDHITPITSCVVDLYTKLIIDNYYLTESIDTSNYRQSSFHKVSNNND